MVHSLATVDVDGFAREKADLFSEQDADQPGDFFGRAGTTDGRPLGEPGPNLVAGKKVTIEVSVSI